MIKKLCILLICTANLGSIFARGGGGHARHGGGHSQRDRLVHLKDLTDSSRYQDLAPLQLKQIKVLIEEKLDEKKQKVDDATKYPEDLLQSNLAQLNDLIKKNEAKTKELMEQFKKGFMEAFQQNLEENKEGQQ